MIFIFGISNSYTSSKTPVIYKNYNLTYVCENYAFDSYIVTESLQDLIANNDYAKTHKFNAKVYLKVKENRQESLNLYLREAQTYKNIWSIEADITYDGKNKEITENKVIFYDDKGEKILEKNSNEKVCLDDYDYKSDLGYYYKKSDAYNEISGIVVYTLIKEYNKNKSFSEKMKPHYEKNAFLNNGRYSRLEYMFEDEYYKYYTNNICTNIICFILWADKNKDRKNPLSTMKWISFAILFEPKNKTAQKYIENTAKSILNRHDIYINTETEDKEIWAMRKLIEFSEETKQVFPYAQSIL